MNWRLGILVSFYYSSYFEEKKRVNNSGNYYWKALGYSNPVLNDGGDVSMIMNSGTLRGEARKELNELSI